MKLVTAIIKPFMLEEIKNALMEVGIEGMTVYEVRGFGRQRGHTEIFTGSTYSVGFLPKLEVQIAVHDELVEAVCSAICSAARTGKIGDGLVLVAPLEVVTRVRTGESFGSFRPGGQHVGGLPPESMEAVYQQELQTLCAHDSDYKLLMMCKPLKTKELELHLQKTKAGLRTAPLLAGICYHLGEPLEDSTNAYMYYTLAAIHGVPMAVELRNAVKAAMSRKEIARAQELTRQFVACHLPDHLALIGSDRSRGPNSRTIPKTSPTLPPAVTSAGAGAVAPCQAATLLLTPSPAPSTPITRPSPPPDPLPDPSSPPNT